MFLFGKEPIEDVWKGDGHSKIREKSITLKADQSGFLLSNGFVKPRFQNRNFSDPVV